MEKQKEILSDDELKEVAGGAVSSKFAKSNCGTFTTPEKCVQSGYCKWRNNLCIKILT